MEINYKKIIKFFIFGLIFGFSSPIPGVSAGAMAILLNIYDGFFNSLNVTAAKKNILIIISFLSGWGIGLLSIANIMVFLFENHGQIVSFIFIGLILGCVPMIYKKASSKKVKIKNIIICILALVFMFLLTFYSGSLTSNNTIEQLGGITPAGLSWLFVASFLSSMAMFIPGVGGSLMMIVFGIYAIYMEAVSTLNILILTILILGMTFGVFSGIFLIKKMIEKFSQTLYSAILGFVLGSLFILYPGFSFDLTGTVSIVAVCLCFAFAYWLSKKG